MDDSILNTIKKMLGLTQEIDHFDLDLILHINSVFSTLEQIGISNIPNFTIEDASTEWHDYVGDNEQLLSLVKMYVFLRVKIVFDPPTASSAVEATNSMIKEYEWRIFSIVDFDEEE